ncbi:MAG: hypothetical protein ACREL9_11460 [Gemmatimonadales bacterium]
MALGWQRAGDDSLSRAYSRRASALNRGLSPRDSLLVAADSLNAVLYTGPRDTAWFGHARRLFATVDHATRRYPEDPEVWYALGEARYHFGFAPAWRHADPELRPAALRGLVGESGRVGRP